MTEFTPEQRKELDQRAEARDLTPPRRSLFSMGEQNALDHTAKILRAEAAETAEILRMEAIERAKFVGFNEEQSANLTHRFNVVEAKDLTARLRKRIVPIFMTTLVIIGLISDTIWQQSQTDQTRAAIVRLCQHQQQVPCKNLFK